MIAKDEHPVSTLPPVPLMLGVAAAAAVSVALVWLSTPESAVALAYGGALVTVLLMLLLIVFLTWGAWEHFARSFDCARPLCSRDSSIDIGLPTWPSKLVVPVAFVVLAARVLLQAVGYGRALVLGLENPVAVPLSISVAEQARLEAESLGGSD